MSSLVEEENNMVRRFLGEYLVRYGFREFHVSKYSPITQEFEPYGIYEDHTVFEKRHNIISSKHLHHEGDVSRYVVYFVLEETE